jgi:hypothetical protein
MFQEAAVERKRATQCHKLERNLHCAVKPTYKSSENSARNAALYSAALDPPLSYMQPSTHHAVTDKPTAYRTPPRHPFNA